MYNEEWKPICEICWCAFERVWRHVNLAHKMSMKTYKEKFWFNNKKGICSKKSRLKSRKLTLSNYELCINQNLLKKWKKTRFKGGYKWRTKDQVREEAKIVLRELYKYKKDVN
jgi:hypothetical protein